MGLIREILSREMELLVTADKADNERMGDSVSNRKGIVHNIYVNTQKRAMHITYTVVHPRISSPPK